MSGRTAWSLRLTGLGTVGVAGVVLGLAPALSACGGRTGLELDELPELPDASSAVPEAGALPDVAQPPDAAIPISPPNTPPACVQLPAPSIYMVSVNANLWQFKPGTNGSAASVSQVGHINCPVSPTPEGMNLCTVPTPFSMAVDRTGAAFVVYCDGEVFAVNTQSLSCAAVGIVPTHFGMAFSQDTTDPDETLFVAEGMDEATLASIDTTTLANKVIGVFSPTAMDSELTGSGAGDLFAFYANNGSEMSIAKVDKTNAVLTNILPLPGLPMGGGWAFVFWGGQFFTFTGTGPKGPDDRQTATAITSISPVDGSQTPVANVGDLIVGAGVSTCAPQQ